VNTPYLVEAMLGGVVGCDEAAEAYPELQRLRDWAGTPGEAAPLQWLLLTLDLPLARGLLRHTALALLHLLDVADTAWATDAIDGCGKFRAICHAPPWLLVPPQPDDRDDDAALVWERDTDFGGNWYALLEALHQAGSVEWQWAIQRCRTMMAFERMTGLDVARLFGLGKNRAAVDSTASIE
jgi:hypothetical protein